MHKRVNCNTISHFTWEHYYSFSFSFTFYHLIVSSYSYKCRASPEQHQKTQHIVSSVGEEEERGQEGCRQGKEEGAITGGGRALCLGGGLPGEGPGAAPRLMCERLAAHPLRLPHTAWCSPGCRALFSVALLGLVILCVFTGELF